jgi:hypothetical protein
MLDPHDPIADRPQKAGRVFEFCAEVRCAHRTGYDCFARGAPSLQSGMKLLIGKSDFNAALPLFQSAIDLDPNFAASYSGLVLTYLNLMEIRGRPIAELRSLTFVPAYQICGRLQFSRKHRTSS